MSVIPRSPKILQEHSSFSSFQRAISLSRAYISALSFLTIIFVCFPQRLHAKVLISPVSSAGSGERQMKWASALQCAQAVSVTRVGDMSVIGECRFAMSAPQAGVQQTFPHRPMRRTDGAHQHPNSTGQKVSGNSGRMRSSEKPLYKNCTPQEYRRLADSAGPEMSALGHKRTFAVHQPMSALPPITTAKADIALRGACSSRQEEYDHARQWNLTLPTLTRVPWNKGKLIGAKPPLRQKHVWAIRGMLQNERNRRDLAMFNLAIDSKLRGCDVVAIKVEDVAPNWNAVDRATVRQRKTGRPVRFELTEHTRQAIDTYLKSSRKKPGEFLFTGPRSERGMTPRQYGRLVSGWLMGIGLDPHWYGTHSLRRTKATLIYRRTGNLRAVQLLLGHTKIESTVRYLGIDVDDALTIAEQVDV
jgi:hypothetical protein